MARKAIVDKDIILNMLKEGETTQRIAEKFGVSRQAIDLHRRAFINNGLLHDRRATRIKRVTKETVPPKRNNTAPPKRNNIIQLDQQIELIIEAFSALKRLPELGSELERYKRKYENAVQKIEHLREVEQKRQDQEHRWLLVQDRKDIRTSLKESGEAGES